jgi:hypothetical protein
MEHAVELCIIQKESNEAVVIRKASTSSRLSSYGDDETEVTVDQRERC